MEGFLGYLIYRNLYNIQIQISFICSILSNLHPLSELARYIISENIFYKYTNTNKTKLLIDELLINC